MRGDDEIQILGEDILTYPQEKAAIGQVTTWINERGMFIIDDKKLVGLDAIASFGVFVFFITVAVNKVRKRDTFVVAIVEKGNRHNCVPKKFVKCQWCQECKILT